MSAPWNSALPNFYSVFEVDKYFGSVNKINLNNNKYLYENLD
jgi:hypothetical protein